MSKPNDLLVVINLRGGADALNIVTPYRDQNYYRLRPSLALAAPNKAGPTLLDLDGFFGLHPALAPILPLYQRGDLAFVHAVGWPGDNRSHFKAWQEIESGAIGEDLPNTGWLARYLQLRSATARTPLRAVAFGELLPRLLAGALGASALRSLEDFHLASQNRSINNALRAVYQNDDSALGALGIETLDALDAMEKLLAQDDRSNGEQHYPKTVFGRQLHAIEKLIRADVGLEAASAELDGWDTHIQQASTVSTLLAELAQGLACFTENLKDQLSRIMIVAISEFGRRAIENGSAGTDHGQGGLMIFCGGGVRGGRVYGEWPGLADERLAPPGDLAITTDFRDALGELAAARLGEAANARIFPGYRISKRLGFLN